MSGDGVSPKDLVFNTFIVAAKILASISREKNCLQALNLFSHQWIHSFC